jgi:hypothetical protein
MRMGVMLGVLGSFNLGWLALDGESVGRKYRTRWRR